MHGEHPAMQDGVALVARAADFAARRHARQTRKGVAAEPYVNHLAEVADLLAAATTPSDAVLVAAGWLHDTVEDTETTHDELVVKFGAAVADLVAEVTDDRSLPKVERKRLQVSGTPRKRDGAKLIKLADKISNLRSISVSPPPDWAAERCRDYVAWAADVVASARPLNRSLSLAFDAAADDAHRAIERRYNRPSLEAGSFDHR